MRILTSQGESSLAVPQAPPPSPLDVPLSFCNKDLVKVGLSLLCPGQACSGLCEAQRRVGLGAAKPRKEKIQGGGGGWGWGGGWGMAPTGEGGGEEERQIQMLVTQEVWLQQPGEKGGRGQKGREEGRRGERG